MMFNVGAERDDLGLRSELDRITRAFVGDEVGRQIPAIAALKSRFGHDITLEAEAIPSDRKSWKYTCFQHAFDLVDPPWLIVTIANADHLYPGSEFVAFLTSNVLDTIGPEQVADGDVVVYSSKGIPKHAGKCRAGRVVSKWGEMHVWRHRLFEVPLRYDSAVLFHRSISRPESVAAFIEYATLRLGRARMDYLRTAP
jgi:hypothetical protein